MSGFGALGLLAFDEAPPFAYPLDLLGDESPGVEFVYVAEIYPFNLGATGVETSGSFPIGSLPLTDGTGVDALYFATREWATAPTDMPPSQAFDGRLANPLSFQRSLLGSDRFAAFATGGGSLSIDNADGAYDSFITGYGIDGRRVVVKAGRTTDPYDSFVTLFDGTARDWRGSAAAIDVILRDNGFKLDTPAQPTVYAGTGSEEGGDDLAGKRRPLLLGLVEHGPLVLVDPALLIYQANAGAIDAGMVVHDQGVALTPNGANQASYAALAALSLASGEFELWPAGGYVKLGALPAGRVTFRDGEGFGLATTADIVRQAIAGTTLLDPQEIDEASFDTLDAGQPADVGTFIGPDAAATAADVAADLLGGIGAFAAFDRLGRLFVRRIVEPTGTPRDNFTDADIVSLDRDPLPSGLSPPPWRVRAAYMRNFETMAGGDLAASVTAADRAYLGEPFLLAQASDPSILAAHPLAQDPAPVEGFFAAKADAEDEAERLLFLFGAGRSLWRVAVPRRGLALELGDVVSVDHPRFGLSGGRSMVVLETTPNLAAGDAVDTVEIVAYG